MNELFHLNERLGIQLPLLDRPWHEFNLHEQTEILSYWEQIRGTIPERIIVFERIINVKQQQLFEEESFEYCCLLNDEIAEYASRINDLHIWYRVNQTID